MRYPALALALATTVLSSNAFAAPISTTSMIAEVGCKTRYSEDKAADIFANKYKGQRAVAQGEIVKLDKGNVYLKLLSATLSYDIDVELRDPRAAYDMEKGQRVAVEFTVNSHGGCFLPFSGNDGAVPKKQTSDPSPLRITDAQNESHAGPSLNNRRAKLKKRKYPKRQRWSRMSIMEERFYDGLKTRETDVAQAVVKFGQKELSLKVKTVDLWAQGYFRELAKTIAAQPQNRLNHFSTVLEREIKRRKR